MLKVFAPAKVNLYLHVTGRQADGYHTLDSLVTFADVGDMVTFEKAREFSLTVDGPFAGSFTRAELETSPQSKNLIVKAAWQLSGLLARELDVAIHLTKNLPFGSGLGGGSADAAACMWGLCQFWNVPLPEGHRTSLALQLGRDVPVCLKSHTTFMRGTGEYLFKAPEVPEIPVVLAWPGQPVSTGEVFQNLGMSVFSDPVQFAASYDMPQTISDFLALHTRNDLQATSCALNPLIHKALGQIAAQPGCQLARMSGSGSACFGVFENEERSQAAAEALTLAHPGWWVRSAWLNRVSRY